MATILTVEQGGTGVQSIDALKSLIGLGSAASINKSDNYMDNNHETVASSYALNEAYANLNKKISDVVPISRGGTGATTPEEARLALGISSGSSIPLPVSINDGGTGATTVSSARANLGINLPLPIADGGTGGTSSTQALYNLGLTIPIPISKGGTGATTASDAVKTLIGLPIPINRGGTNAINAYDARRNLGIETPFAVSIGGTGAESLEEAQSNLGIKNITISSGNPVNGNDGDIWIKYKS